MSGGGKRGERFSPLMAVIIAVIILAGTLFGYDQGVISGALAGISKAFHLGALLTEVVTSWVTLGALVGSLIGGELADRIGRKKAVLAAGVLFTLGAVLQSVAPHPPLLVGGRLVIGVGVGLAAVAAPLYGAEMAPAALRGRFVSAYQLAITIGIFIAYQVDATLTADNGGWRLMLGVAGFVGVALFLVMLAAPESPRWLLKVGRRADALAELRAVRPDADQPALLADMEAALSQEAHKASWREVFAPELRRPLAIAVGLAVYQQITGINAIIYYADNIFAAAGFASPAAQTLATTWAIGAVNVLATFIAIAFIDKLGRRPLLLAGLIGMGVSLVVVGTAFTFIGAPAAGASGPSAGGIVTMIGLIVFIVSFAFSLGPVVWTVINEIFPGRVRGRAVSVATAVNWGAAFVVSEFFLTLIHAIGRPATFWLFAFFCVSGWVWIWRQVPETKGRTLEEIEQIWAEEAGLAPALRRI